MANAESMPREQRGPDGGMTATGIGWKPASVPALPSSPNDDARTAPVQRPFEQVSPQRSQFGGSGIFSGEARAVQLRTEQENQQLQSQIWTFRIHRFDSAGNALPPIPVEMRARRFDGAINEGDWVEVAGQWEPGRILVVSEVQNLTTSSRVVAEKEHRGVAVALMFVAVTLMVLIVAAGIFLTWYWLQHFGGP